MDEKNIIIRKEKKEEQSAVENLVRESFWNVYRPGCSEHYILHRLRKDPSFVGELDFVMEKDGELIGQVVFVRANIAAEGGGNIPVMTAGPISVIPSHQRQGYGKLLFDYALDRAKEFGCGAVLIEGNIDFYGKCGFSYASEFGIRYHGVPFGEDTPFFLCKELTAGYLSDITGEYLTPEVYSTDESEVEKFDKAFPPKEKLKLPGQIF